MLAQPDLFGSAELAPGRGSSISRSRAHPLAAVALPPACQLCKPRLHGRHDHGAYLPIKSRAVIDIAPARLWPGCSFRLTGPAAAVPAGRACIIPFSPRIGGSSFRGSRSLLPFPGEDRTRAAFGLFVCGLSFQALAGGVFKVLNLPSEGGWGAYVMDNRTFARVFEGAP